MAIAVTLDIDDDVAKRIAQAVDRPNDIQGACTDFAGFAFEQMRQWVDGSTRYRSLTDQHLAWVELLYDEIIPKGLVPTTTRLYNALNMPYGQANYIARALAEKALTEWRKNAFEILKEDVKQTWPVFKAFLTRNEADRTAVLRTTKMAGLELIRVSDEIWTRDRTFVPPAQRVASGISELSTLKRRASRQLQKQSGPSDDRHALPEYLDDRDIPHAHQPARDVLHVQLTNWLRDLLSLKAKFDFNNGGNQDDEKKAIREVRYTLASLYNFLPFLVALAISAFIGFAALNAFDILGPYIATDPLASKLAWALGIFVTIYVALVVFLLGRGYWIGFHIQKELK